MVFYFTTVQVAVHFRDQEVNYLIAIYTKNGIIFMRSALVPAGTSFESFYRRFLNNCTSAMMFTGLLSMRFITAGFVFHLAVGQHVRSVPGPHSIRIYGILSGGQHIRVMLFLTLLRFENKHGHND